MVADRAPEARTRTWLEIRRPIWIYLDGEMLLLTLNCPHRNMLALEGYDTEMLDVKLIAPLKIDVDWKWTLDEKGCNDFSVR
ncbi:unnamed protein product [Nippostrongylus brasiliensis]|uniref:Rieske domain-containing protein n=1 Tax=Nippostrongylus brasiliensis TaxID=27835 RepID=A0A0N4XSN5_NIPBR|nr:unnamed protein product [Nippostrongylus brasiliensis]